MMIIVFFFFNFLINFKNLFSEFLSNALVGSSKINISLSKYRALASAKRCNCPTEKFFPFYIISELIFFFNFLTNFIQFVSLSTSNTFSVLILSCPKAIFSFIVPFINKFS